MTWGYRFSNGIRSSGLDACFRDGPRCSVRKPMTPVCQIQPGPSRFAHRGSLARNGAGRLTMAGILFYDLESIPHLGFWPAETAAHNFPDQESTP